MPGRGDVGVAVLRPAHRLADMDRAYTALVGAAIATNSGGATVQTSTVTRELSEATKRQLRGHYDGKSMPVVLISVVHGMIAASWPLDAICDYFDTRQVKFVRDARLHYLDRFRSEIEQAYQAATVRRGDHSQRCGIARGVIVDEWSGTEASQFRTLFGLYGIAETSGSLIFTASRRQVAEAVGLGGVSDHDASYTTAANAVAKLHERGLIEFHAAQHRPGERNAHSTYRLHPPDQLGQALARGKDETCTPIPFALTCVLPAPTASAHAPAVVATEQEIRGTETVRCIPKGSTWESALWEPAGLGPTACRVWHLLSERGALGVKPIAERLGIATSSTKDALRKLASHGLVASAERKHHVTDVAIEAVAALIGVADRDARRAQGNQHHRGSRDTYLSRPRDVAEPIGVGLFDDDGVSVDAPTVVALGDGRQVDTATGEIVTEPVYSLASDIAEGEAPEVVARILGFGDAWAMEAQLRAVRREATKREAA